MFREGESDEYNSEVDGDAVDIDAPEINFDILEINKSSNPYHKTLVNLVMKSCDLPEDFENLMTFDNHRKEVQKQVDDEYKEKLQRLQDGEEFDDDESFEKKYVTNADITTDYLTCDQVFIFSDEITIYHEKIQNAILAVIDTKVFLLFKESKSSIYRPFDLEELSAIVMSPSNPMSAAFKMKDQNKLKRSHIVFQNNNMGLLVRFI